jgi:SAM-dependent methyltransferase
MSELRLAYLARVIVSTASAAYDRHMDDVHAGHTSHGSRASSEGLGSLAETLDLDAEITRSYWEEVMRWIAQAHPTDVRRIVDLGAGTGAGTFALAGRFDHAEVLAVDASDEMLERVREKALDRGLAERVRTVQADLDTDWPETGPMDLTWASMFMHHLADVDGVLERIHKATREGGLIVIAEFTDPPRFLPDELELGEPGLEGRCIEAFKRERLRSLPGFGLQWGRRLERAGFSAIEERVFDLEGETTDPGRLARYGRLWLERVSSAAAPHLSSDDLSVLNELLADAGPHSLEERSDLYLQGSRVVVRAAK